MPNTIVSAAGEALPAANLNRRRARAIAGSALTATLAGVAACSASTAAAYATTLLPSEPAAASKFTWQERLHIGIDHLTALHRECRT